MTEGWTILEKILFAAFLMGAPIIAPFCYLPALAAWSVSRKMDKKEKSK